MLGVERAPAPPPVTSDQRRGRLFGRLAVRAPVSCGERLVKKGRHRRFEEARSLKRAVEVVVEPCPECGADPEDDHASWCLYESEELDEDENEGATSD
jgi:hypothetical protein